MYRSPGIAPHRQRLFFRGREITADIDPISRGRGRKKRALSSHTLSWFGIVDCSVLYLQCSTASDISPIVHYGFCSVLCSDNSSFESNRKLIKQCTLGLFDDRKPSLSADGEGGTYFFENYRDGKWQKVGCFKPSDEEAGAINNPRGRTDPRQAMHCGIKPTEGHLREIAAYLLDTGQTGTKYVGFHSVPPTMRVEVAAISSTDSFHYNPSIPSPIGLNPLTSGASANRLNPKQSADSMDGTHRKIGSLQQFVAGEVVENLGVQNFAIREVHKIGILDIRMLNCDRNSGNVLVSRNDFGRLELIPIDHGLSMPEQLEITRDSWVWLHWTQSREPFDPFTLQFINQIDVEHDILRLKSELNFREIVFENMRVSHLVLKRCANSGLTLHQIGSIIARPDFDTKSILEELMVQAEALAIERCRQQKHLTSRFKRKGSTSRHRGPMEPRVSSGLGRDRTVSLQTPSVLMMDADDEEQSDREVQRRNGLKSLHDVIHDDNARDHGGNSSMMMKQNGKMNQITTSTVPIANPLVFVPSRVPNGGTSSLIGGNGSIPVMNSRVHSAVYLKGKSITDRIQVLNTRKVAHSEKATSSMSGMGSFSPNISVLNPLNSLRLCHTSSDPMALGSMSMRNASSSTPEPFMLFPAPRAIVVHKKKKKKKDDGDTKQNENMKADFFWTPNYRATSMSSMTATNSSKRKRKEVRSATPPDRTESKTSKLDFVEMPGLSLEHSIEDEANEVIEDINRTPSLKGQGQREHVGSVNDGKGHRNGLQIESLCLSPIQLHPVKTSSIQERGGSISEERRDGPSMNPIFKTISAATTETDSTRTTSASAPEDEEDNDADDVRQSRNVEDVDPLMFQQHISVQPDRDEVAKSKIKSPINVHQPMPNGSGPVPFDSLNLEVMKSKKNGLTPSSVSQSTKNGMAALSRSASCIDVPKMSAVFTSGLSATAEIGTPTMKRDDSLLSSSSMSSSMIGNPTMMQFRREQLSMNMSDAAMASRSHSMLRGHVLGQQATTESVTMTMTTDSTKQVLSGDGESPSSGNLVGTPSAGGRSISQDDMVAKDSNFGIHPIMERMASNEVDVRKWFFFYLEQLLGIQCHRITTRSKTDDGNDDIYDVDTVNGSFIWKNELRKHWVRSRIERRKLMAAKPPENPFEKSIKFANESKAAQNQRSCSPMADTSKSPEDPYLDQMADSALSGGNLLMESHSQSDDAGDDWFGMDETVDHDDDSESPD